MAKGFPNGVVSIIKYNVMSGSGWGEGCEFGFEGTWSARGRAGIRIGLWPELAQNMLIDTCTAKNKKSLKIFVYLFKQTWPVKPSCVKVAQSCCSYAMVGKAADSAGPTFCRRQHA